MLARDVMTTDVATVAAHTPVEEVARFLLERRISGAPVVDDDNRVIGIVSEGDLIHRAEIGTERQRSWWLSFFASREEVASDYVKSHGRRAADVMTKNVITVSEDTSLADVAALLERRRIKRVPVVRAGKLAGIVSRADILRALAAHGRDALKTPSGDDRAIREQFLERIEKEGLPRPALVNVVVTDGVVHLWGFVDTEQERDALRVLAESIPGVQNVEDHLATNPRYVAGT